LHFWIVVVAGEVDGVVVNCKVFLPVYRDEYAWEGEGKENVKVLST
jgi:hypothetical protein